MSKETKLSRRTFLLGAGAAGVVGCRLITSEERPLFKAGIVTDTHVLQTRESLERVRRAYRLFAANKVSLIANLGDIADEFYPKGYRYYSEARELAYPDKNTRPKEIFLWANHDRVNFTPGVYASSYEDAFAAAKPILGITNEMYDRVEIGGYTFLAFPQGLDIKKYEAMIAQAAADNPGKPFFVMCHVPPYGTTGGGAGEKRLTDVLSRYPQAINLCGHSHGTLRDPRLIWQGAFTCINFGCLQNWSGGFRGRIPEPKENWNCAILEFYSDRLIVRRMSLKDGLEIEPNDPWTVYWGDRSRYLAKMRIEAERAPQFAANAKLKFVPDATPLNNLTIKIPASDDSRGTRGYRLKIEQFSSDWQTLAVRETCGDFWRETNESAATEFDDVLPASFLEEGKRCRFTAEPFGLFGKVGRSIVSEYTIPKLADNKPLCVITDGLPTLHGGDKWELPEVVQRYPKDTKFRAIVDVESDADLPLNFRMQCYPRKEVLSGWISCERGKHSRRHILDFIRGKGNQKVYLAAPFSKETTQLTLKRVVVELI